MEDSGKKGKKMQRLVFEFFALAFAFAFAKGDWKPKVRLGGGTGERDSNQVRTALGWR